MKEGIMDNPGNLDLIGSLKSPDIFIATKA